MSKRITVIVLVLLGISFYQSSMAASQSQEDIKKALSSYFPGISMEMINPSPMAGVSEVLIGPSLFYVSNDGRYLLQGSLIDVKTRTDISEERRNGLRLDAINKMGEDKMIVFPAKESRHTITVFTDIDCGYCRKLHKEMDKYNAEGITVRYLMFPRTGINSPSYDKAVSVWCSKDQLDAMTRSKLGKPVPKASCDNPVKAQYELGLLVGVKGTPALILDDGTMLPGYIPAAKLSKALNKGS